MARAVESGVVLAGGKAETLSDRVERVLRAVGENENAENLVIGLGAVTLCFLVGYAIIVLSKCPLGVFAIGLG